MSSKKVIKRKPVTNDKGSVTKGKGCGTNKLCKECGEILTDRTLLHEENDDHHIMALQYCEEHEIMYIHHKCKPCWCKICGYLDYYNITLQEHIYGKSRS